MKHRILANPAELGKAVGRLIDTEEWQCARRPDASAEVVNDRRLVAFETIWELVHEHTVGYEDEDKTP